MNDECCNDGFNFWTDIGIPVVISPLLLVAKILWDRYNKKQEEARQLKNKSKLTKISDKLKHFYWPLYILLLRDYDLWSQFSLFDDNFYDFVESDTESEISDNEDDDNPVLKCSYTELSSDTEPPIRISCNNPIAKNSCTKGPRYCLKHINKSFTQNIEITTYNQDNSESTFIPVSGNNETIVDFSGIDVEAGESKISLRVNTDEIPGNFTGNEIGEIDGLNNNTTIDKVSIDDETRNNLTDTMLDNHQKINDIIIEFISEGEPNSFIGKQLVKYLKFITIVKSTFKHNNNLNPVKFNSPYPKKLLPLIEKKVFSLQKDYNELIDTFYYK